MASAHRIVDLDIAAGLSPLKNLVERRSWRPISAASTSWRKARRRATQMRSCHRALREHARRATVTLSGANAFGGRPCFLAPGLPQQAPLLAIQACRNEKAPDRCPAYVDALGCKPEMKLIDRHLRVCGKRRVHRAGVRFKRVSLHPFRLQRAISIPALKQFYDERQTDIEELRCCPPGDARQDTSQHLLAQRLRISSCHRSLDFRIYRERGDFRASTA